MPVIDLTFRKSGSFSFSLGSQLPNRKSVCSETTMWKESPGFQMAGGGAEREKEHLLASWLLDGPQLFQPLWGVRHGREGAIGMFQPHGRDLEQKNHPAEPSLGCRIMRNHKLFFLSHSALGRCTV